MDRPERNVQTVAAMLELAFGPGGPDDREAALAEHVSPAYRQHNPWMDDGTTGLVSMGQVLRERYPDIEIDTKRVIATDEYVVMHHEVRNIGLPLGEPADGTGFACVDIWRLDDDGRVVEHWDVMQEIPARSTNANGMF